MNANLYWFLVSFVALTLGSLVGYKLTKQLKEGSGMLGLFEVVWLAALLAILGGLVGTFYFLFRLVVN